MPRTDVRLSRAFERADIGDRGKVSGTTQIDQRPVLSARAARVTECNAELGRRCDPRLSTRAPSASGRDRDGLVTPVVFDADQKGIGRSPRSGTLAIARSTGAQGATRSPARVHRVSTSAQVQHREVPRRFESARAGILRSAQSVDSAGRGQKPDRVGQAHDVTDVVRHRG